MRKTWLSAISIVGVLGTGSAAVLAGAVMNNGLTVPSSAPVLDINSPGTAVYQVGDAARIEVSAQGGIATIASAVASSTSWQITSISSPGAIATVVLTGPTQIVTFTATAVGNDVQASVSATATTTAALQVVPDPATAPVPAAVTQLNLPVTPAVTGSQDADDDDDDDEEEEEDDDDNNVNNAVQHENDEGSDDDDD